MWSARENNKKSVPGRIATFVLDRLYLDFFITLNRQLQGVLTHKLSTGGLEYRNVSDGRFVADKITAGSDKLFGLRIIDHQTAHFRRIVRVG